MVRGAELIPRKSVVRVHPPLPRRMVSCRSSGPRVGANGALDLRITAVPYWRRSRRSVSRRAACRRSSAGSVVEGGALAWSREPERRRYADGHRHPPPRHPEPMREPEAWRRIFGPPRSGAPRWASHPDRTGGVPSQQSPWGGHRRGHRTASEARRAVLRWTRAGTSRTREGPDTRPHRG